MRRYAGVAEGAGAPVPPSSAMDAEASTETATDADLQLRAAGPESHCFVRAGWRLAAAATIYLAYTLAALLYQRTTATPSSAPQAAAGDLSLEGLDEASRVAVRIRDSPAGCLNWESIVKPPVVKRPFEECRSLCAGDPECTGFSFQDAECVIVVGPPVQQGACYLYKGTCQIVDSACFATYVVLAEASTTPEAEEPPELPTLEPTPSPTATPECPSSTSQCRCGIALCGIDQYCDVETCRKVETMTTTEAVAGQQTLDVANTDHFQVGDFVSIGDTATGGLTEAGHIVAIGSITLEAVLKYNWPAGTPVAKLPIPITPPPTPDPEAPTPPPAATTSEAESTPEPTTAMECLWMAGTYSDDGEFEVTQSACNVQFTHSDGKAYTGILTGSQLKVDDPNWELGNILPSGHVHFSDGGFWEKVSAAPTVAPTLEPAPGPTFAPTLEPVLLPTLAPTLEPAPLPTFAPTLEPVPLPTLAPTLEPVPLPTLAPTLEPVPLPTLAPTLEPVPLPTFAPTLEPATPAPTLEVTEPAATTTQGPSPEECDNAQGTYKDSDDGNDGQPFVVTQLECRIEFVYDGKGETGLVTGSTFQVTGWPSAGTINANGVTFGDGGSWQKVCPAGQYGVFPDCQACAAGKFSNPGGAAECTNCPDGRISSAQGATECQACAAGKLAEGGITCADMDCPEQSTGTSVSSGCECEAGYSGDIVAVSDFPRYYTGSCQAVKCPANSAGTDVPTGCTCNVNYVGTIIASSEAPFYTGTCTPIDGPVTTTEAEVPFDTSAEPSKQCSYNICTNEKEVIDLFAANTCTVNSGVLTAPDGTTCLLDCSGVTGAAKSEVSLTCTDVTVEMPFQSDGALVASDQCLC